MNSLISCGRLHAAIAVLAIPVVVMVMLGSCNRRGASNTAYDAHYMAVDSMLAGVNDVDSLAGLLRQAQEEKDAVAEILALRYQGRRLRQLARFDEAIASHQRGLELATELNDTIEMTMALHCLGDVARRKGELSKANGCYYKALHLCEGYSDSRYAVVMKAEAVVLNAIANIEIDLFNFSAADSVLRKSLKMEETLGRNLGIAVNYIDLGQVKLAKGELDSAWFYYRKSMEFHQLAGSEKGMAMCHFRYGELHEADNRFSHAIKEYTIAYEKLKETGDTWQWLKPCIALAHVNILMGEEELASRYLHEAEAESHRIGSKVFESDAHMIHYEFSLLKGDSEDALQHYIKGTEMADSILGLRQSDEMRAQRIAYQNSRKSGEVDVLNNDIAHLKQMRNRMILLGVILTLMAGAIIASLVYAMRVRARTQRVMRQIEETRSLFFTNVVHRLRTPLTAIMGAIDIILNRAKSLNPPISAETTNDLEMVGRQGNNLLELVDRILEVGSVRSAVSSLDWRTGNVVPFIRMVIESYRERCVDRQIELAYASREKSIEMDAVANYLSTIVGSLVENAINYSRDFSKITVTTRQENGSLVIKVADNGMGISQADLPHVFEPFYRGAPAEQLIEGVGIGLTVVRDMATALGGTVAVESKKDSGSVFTVTLPCKCSKDIKARLDEIVSPVLKIRPQRLITRVNPSSDAQRNEDNDRPVVLVVEDHGDVAQLVGKTLEQLFVVLYASDGERALALAMDHHPDLIVTDVKMPVMDGCELCRKVRQSSQLRHIPIIMLSARTAKEDRIRGIKAGADVYLVKPFISEELLAFAAMLLENRKITIEHYSDTLSPSESVLPPGCEAANSLDDQAFLERFNELVGEQFAGGASRVDLDKIALAFKMGESALRRKVQAVTGKNAISYITHLRMEKAMSLLRQHPDMLVGDVAERCGFTDIAYFSRVFRQHYGMTPTQARSGGDV